MKRSWRKVVFYTVPALSGSSQKLQGTLSGTWSTSFPSFFTSLVVCQVVYLSGCFCAVTFFFFVNLLSQRLYYHCCWWAQPWPAAEPDSTGSVGHGGNFCSCSQKWPLWKSPLPEPGHADRSSCAWLMSHNCIFPLRFWKDQEGSKHEDRK